MPKARQITYFVLPLDCPCGQRTWAVAGFNGNGRWESVTPGFATERAAEQHRQEMGQGRKRLAAEQAVRAAKTQRMSLAEEPPVESEAPVVEKPIGKRK
jgi:hypothetical protein